MWCSGNQELVLSGTENSVNRATGSYVRSQGILPVGAKNSNAAYSTLAGSKTVLTAGMLSLQYAKKCL